MNFGLLNDAAIGVFAEPVAYRRAGVPEIVVQAVYDSRHYETNDGEVSGSDLITSIAVRIAEVSDPRIGDGVTARGIDYEVREVRPDGQGMATLILERT